MSQALSPEDKKRLLAIAHQTVEDASVGRAPRAWPTAPGQPPDERGAFVTLHKNGQLRGCIGNFVGDGSLERTVSQMAVAAASQDPRFRPLRPDELAEIDIEVSVLSPLERIDDPELIEVGRHGIYLISPRGRGVLLPQVAVEQGWDRWTFLDHTCLKAGLNPGCWREPEVNIFIFSADIFGESQA